MAVVMDKEKKWVKAVRAGNTVKVWQKVKEGEKTRLQAFEGLVIAHKHGLEPGATFTVRKISEGIGVERIFPLYSPNIEKVDLVKSSKVRRAKLYYIREKAAKEIKKKMRKLKERIGVTEVKEPAGDEVAGEKALS
ncbi:MAG TPA: 50S ribosomal protein L19 [Candidatus Paceibacterota bacterium]